MLSTKGFYLQLIQLMPELKFLTDELSCRCFNRTKSKKEKEKEETMSGDGKPAILFEDLLKVDTDDGI